MGKVLEEDELEKVKAIIREGLDYLLLKLPRLLQVAFHEPEPAPWPRRQGRCL